MVNTEKNAERWVIKKIYIGNDKMTSRNRKGLHPTKWEFLSIESQKPIIASEPIEDYKHIFIGGLASFDTAKSYVTDVLKGRPMPKGDSNEFTLAEFDEYAFVEDYCRYDYYNDGDSIDTTAGLIALRALSDKIGLIGNVYDYLFKQADE